MLRVGLTGGLGSGKSTVAAMLAERGAVVVSSDELAREMMRPGEPVYRALVGAFGAGVVRSDGALDRPALARIAFEQARVAELEAIVHPAVLARQAEMADALQQQRPDSVLVVESALLLTTQHAGEGGWRRRFDRIVVVTAPEEIRVARFAGRRSGGVDEAAAHAEARRRLSHQMPESEMAAQADFVLANTGSLEQLSQDVDQLWTALKAAQPKRTRQDLPPGSIQ